MKIPENDISVEVRLCQLAEFYVDMVYSAALRQMNRDTNLAADVTQVVMVAMLTRSRAGKLPADCYMAGWLLTVTRYTVKQFKRTAARRSKHETIAATQQRKEIGEPQDDLLLALDEAILALNPLDREVIARRYLKGESLNEIGAAFAMSENTAGRRVIRAVEKLRKSFQHQGINIPAASLVATLSTVGLTKAPSACASISIVNNTSIAIANRVIWKMAMAKTIFPGALFLAMIVIISAAVFVVNATPPNHAVVSAPATKPAAAFRTPIAIHVTQVIADSSVTLLKELLAGLQVNQPKLKTIDITGSIRSAMYDSATKKWLDMQVFEGEAWTEAGGLRRGRTQISLGQTRTLGENGLGPIQDESWVETWDGTTTDRQYGPPHSPAMGQTFNKKDLRGESLLGTDFSMQLPWDLETAADARGSRKVIDRNPLDSSTLAKMRLSARRVKLDDGAEAMELTVDMPNDGVARTETFWFDPNRGYGLLARQDSLSMNGKLLRKFTRRIDELKEVLPGVFYPVKAEWSWEQNGTLFNWTEFKAEKVIANQPQPADLFRINFPDDLEITDYTDGRGTRRDKDKGL